MMWFLKPHTVDTKSAESALTSWRGCTLLKIQEARRDAPAFWRQNDRRPRNGKQGEDNAHTSEG